MTEHIYDAANNRDSVGMYLREIAQTPLLSAEQEVDLSKRIEIGLFAGKCLEARGVEQSELPGYLADLEIESAEVRFASLKTKKDTEEITKSKQKEAKLFAADLTSKIGSIALHEPLAEGQASPSDEELGHLVEDGESARAQFTKANLRLVVSIARKYSRSKMPMLDLVQEGNTGLIRAIEKFDYTRGYKFSTYATWWIRQSITRGIANQARVVRLPVHVAEDIYKIGAVERKLLNDLDREPEVHEIAEEAGVDAERVVDLLKWGREHVSLDVGLDDGSGIGRGQSQSSFYDILENKEAAGYNPEEQIMAHQNELVISQALSLLEDREQEVLRMRMGFHGSAQMTLREVGNRLNVSPERIRQLESKALRRLRLLLEQTPEGEHYLSEVAENELRRRPEEAKKNEVKAASPVTAGPKDELPEEEFHAEAEEFLKKQQNGSLPVGAIMKNSFRSSLRTILDERLGQSELDGLNLTDQQLKALGLYLSGASTKEVAEELYTYRKRASGLIRTAAAVICAHVTQDHEGAMRFVQDEVNTTGRQLNEEADLFLQAQAGPRHRGAIMKKSLKRHLRNLLEENHEQPDAYGLSDEQLTALKLYVSGASNKSVAEVLNTYHQRSSEIIRTAAAIICSQIVQAQEA